MLDIRLIIKILGGLLVIFGLLLLVPALFAVFSHSPLVEVFLASAVLSAGIGSILWIINRSYTSELNHRGGFAIVTLSWFAACLFGALPYFLSGELVHFYDAFFESTSGFTGTGASVIEYIDGVDRSLLLWRSMTQWMGGMGIIVFFIAILPLLGVGGVQLFKAEITGPQKDKLTPRVRETAKKLWILYVAFTAALALILRLLGMSGYDAVNHAMTTLSTGGFSTKGAGLAHFDSAAIDYAIIAFMLIGSISFGLHYRVLVGRDIRSLFSTELGWYLSILFLATIVLTISIWEVNYDTLEESIRYALFTTVATGSSTGFTNPDYAVWSPGCSVVIVLLMVMGGMSGSTAGGIKCIRLVAAYKHFLKELVQVVHPRAVLTVKTDDHSIPVRVIEAIWAFIFLYFFIFSFATVLLTFQGLPLVEASTATFSALSNIGPALGSLGPTGNFAEVAVSSKVTLTFCMILGRLEIFTVLVILTPAYWKK